METAKKYERRSWWAKGETVLWAEAGYAKSGVVVEPRGDYSWIAVNGGGTRLVANGELYKLVPKNGSKA